jgi:hypothetical protein
MYIQTKLIPNETTTLILKARGARRAALGSGSLGSARFNGLDWAQ